MIKIVVTFLFLSLTTFGCGKPDAHGFFSDSNICRPTFEEDTNPIDISAGKVALPAPTSSAASIGQLSANFTENKHVWGVELYLSNLLSDAADLKIQPLIKKSSITVGETITVGPDSSSAVRGQINESTMTSTSTTPGWVRTQFDSAITVASGEAFWIVVKSAATGTQVVNSWYQAGDGIWVAPVGSPIYAKIPSVKLIHRLVYCK